MVVRFCNGCASGDLNDRAVVFSCRHVLCPACFERSSLKVPSHTCPVCRATPVQKTALKDANETLRAVFLGDPETLLGKFTETSSSALSLLGRCQQVDGAQIMFWHTQYVQTCRKLNEVKKSVDESKARLASLKKQILQGREMLAEMRSVGSQSVRSERRRPEEMMSLDFSECGSARVPNPSVFSFGGPLTRQPTMTRMTVRPSEAPPPKRPRLDSFLRESARPARPSEY